MSNSPPTYTQKELLELAGGISRQRFHQITVKRGIRLKQVQGGKGRMALYDAESADAWLASRFLHTVRQDQRRHQTQTRRARTTETGENHVQY